MLLNTLEMYARMTYATLPWEIQNHIGLLRGALVFMIVLSLWRVWRFTIMPLFYPHDPLDLPYWIPFLGHASSFYSNSNALLQKAGLFFGNTKKPYSLTIAGSRLYVITSPKHVTEAYKNTKTLSFHEFVQAMMRSCGTTEYCVETMYMALPKDKGGFANPHGKPLATLARQMHIHQLYPGNNLEHLEQQFMAWLAPRLHIDQLQSLDVCPYGSVDKDSVVLPLMKWCSDFFTRAGQGAYFGDVLARDNPTLTDDFIVFDELSWQILYQYPSFLATKMENAKAILQQALKAYFQIHQGHRTGDAWFTRTMEDEMRALGIGDDDIAKMMVIIYWGINTNTRKAAFWLLAYIMQSPRLIDVIRDETKPAFRDNGSMDHQYLHHECPNLDAMWNETIRMSAFSASVRFITEDTIIGGKILRKGGRAMIPYRQLHFDESVFGQSTDTFNHERFIKNPQLTQSSNWRPFGGGSTMCPGRYIAKRVVMSFVALLVHRFDVEMDGYQRIPAPEEGKPVLGIMSTKAGEDLMVRVRERKAVP